MTKDEALRLALEALEGADEIDCDMREAITAIKAALEVNEFNPDWDTQAVLVEEIQRMAKRIEELEAQRTWVGLTDDEIDTWNIVGHESLREFVRAIEAKLKDKNNA
jgi:hypothetical protein